MSLPAPRLQCRDLAFGYDEVSLLFDSFDLTLTPGERVALKGASGIGKSTLFQLLLGFYKPRSGEILYRDRPWSTQIRRETAWLPQELSLGEGNVRGILLRPFEFKVNRDLLPDKQEILHLMDDLNLDPSLLNQSWSMLSTGQKQRMGMVSVLLLNRPLLLLDEPTSALDDVSKSQLTDRLFHNRHQTILSTSHDPWWLERCDRTIDLNVHFNPESGGNS
ncbi:MAG: ATP-binding cassette domain-containing protein [Balneolaceae bacterium]